MDALLNGIWTYENRSWRSNRSLVCKEGRGEEEVTKIPLGNSVISIRVRKRVDTPKLGLNIWDTSGLSGPVRSVWFVWFHETHQMDQMDQTDQKNQTDQIHKTGW